MSDKVYAIDEIKIILQELLKDEQVYKVILFGSYAKGKATKQSDIDLVIDTKAKLRGFKLLKLISILEQRFNKNVDGYEKYEIIKNSKIDNEIKRTGVVVYEK